MEDRVNPEHRDLVVSIISNLRKMCDLNARIADAIGYEPTGRELRACSADLLDAYQMWSVHDPGDEF